MRFREIVENEHIKAGLGAWLRFISFDSFRVSILTLAFAVSGIAANLPADHRQQVNADFGWKFRLGDQMGAEVPKFDDASWRTINLPHDWSIEGIPDPKNLTGSGGGYFPAGIGWYRKTFSAPKKFG